MNAITTVVIATAALLAVCDVSQAAQPAASKIIMSQSHGQNAVSATATPAAESLRESGQQAQQQILREAIQQDWQQFVLQPLPMLAPIAEERMAESELAERQVAVK